MNPRLISPALTATAPVMMGYLTLGTAFGLMMASAGYGLPWALLMSLVVYAGSAQILGVSLLAAGASLGQTALLILALNLRHMVYGLSMLEKFRGLGLRKFYLIFSLTDETYALLTAAAVPQGVREGDFLLAVAFLNQSYWVTGTLAGSLAGSALGAIPPGVDFAMTALFLVIAVGQWRGGGDHLPALLGGGAALCCRFALGPGNAMLLGTLPILIAVLALRPAPAQTTGRGGTQP